MKKSILLISLAVLPLFGYSQNVLPDWALGGFVRPEKANPIITPNPSNQFDCPMQDKKIGWEESDVFNPAATVKDGKIYVLYRAEDNSATGIGKRTSRIGLAESEDGIHMKRRKTPVMYPDKDNMKEYEWEAGRRQSERTGKSRRLRRPTCDNDGRRSVCHGLHFLEPESGTPLHRHLT